MWAARSARTSGCQRLHQYRSAGLLDVEQWRNGALQRLSPFSVPLHLLPDVDEDMLFVPRVYEKLLEAQEALQAQILVLRL